MLRRLMGMQGRVTVTTWTTTAAALMQAFKKSLQALVPIVSEVKITWEDHDKWDDWENIETVLFNAIVVQAIANDVGIGASQKFAQYDVSHRSYTGLAYIGDASLGDNYALINLSTEDGAFFETCIFVEIDSEGNALEVIQRPFSLVQFTAVLLDQGQRIVTTSFDVEL